MSLPKGYKQLEYIQSSGTQYVNSGIVGQTGIKTVLDFSIISGDLNDFIPIGCAPASYSPRFYPVAAQSGKWAYGYSGWTNSAVAAKLGQRYQIETDFRSGLQNMKVDGSQIASGTATASVNVGLPMFLFGANIGGTYKSYGSIRLYFCQIYDNGTLVLDFIPCQNASGAVGLWDAVNEEFYGNAGTGTFVAGPVVPEIVDESEITELEYIQSSGTQYVDTMFKPNQNTRVIMDAEYLGGDVLFCSATTGTSGMFGLQYVSGKLYFYYGTLSGTTTGAITTGQKQRFEMNQNAVLLDGAVLKTNSAQSFQCTYSLPVFCINVGGSISYFSSLKLFAFSVYDNGLLERDYIPAKLSNGEVGLYDRVFHEFYRNAGTGEFTAGPEMVRDGYTELEYIQSDGTQELHTGVYPSADLSADIVLMPTASGMAENAILGAAWSLNGFFLMFYQNMLRFHSSGASVDVSNFDKTGKNNLKCSSRQFAVNGQAYTLPGTGTDVQQEIVLFYVKDLAGNNFNLPKRGVYTLYSCRFDKSNNPVRVYIPMLHPSGVVGMWDSVNERFYASATTTDLIAGPEAQTVPKSPANFRVESETDTLVSLAWDASEKAVGYRLYRSGQLLADTTETSVSVTVEPFAGAVFTLTAYNENGEGAGAELTYFNAPDDPILFLVTDRTQQDVTERNQKGYYAASDLNRVGFAVEHLQKRLLSAGVSASVSPVLTWTDEEWATPADMTAYLKDVRTMRNALKVAETTPTAPEDMAKLTYSEANDIEAILVALDVHITRMLSIADAGWASGLAYTGFYAKEAY